MPSAARTDAVRILGVDPGLNITGYGVIEFTPDAFQVIEAGVVRPSAKESLPARLTALAAGLRDVIESLKPQAAALEQVFSHVEHPRTAIIMGHARGVICLAIGEAGIELEEYAPTQVKQLLTGSGRASKGQMQMAVAQQLGLPGPPEPPDVADALALALCHGFRLGLGRGGGGFTANAG